jgi:hypothetical protein
LILALEYFQGGTMGTGPCLKYPSKRKAGSRDGGSVPGFRTLADR